MVSIYNNLQSSQSHNLLLLICSTKTCFHKICLLAGIKMHCKMYGYYSLSLKLNILPFFVLI